MGARQQTLILEDPGRIWIVCCTFGWLRKIDGTRRFRVLFVIVPRKNGKSALAAPIGLYMFCADGEFGAEVYSGATNEKQLGGLPARQADGIAHAGTSPVRHRGRREGADPGRRRIEVRDDHRGSRRRAKPQLLDP
jgi:hypothetical protein